MKILLICLLVIHGLIHLLGFVKAFGLAPVAQLSLPISRTVGVFWLLAACLLMGAAILLSLGAAPWGFLAAGGILLSQVLIVLSWADAKWGTAVNVLLVLPMLGGLMNALPSSYHNRYEADVRARLTSFPEPAPVTELDIRHLPAPVQKYLRFTGSVGKPGVVNFRLRWEGTMRTRMDGDWQRIEARQFNFYDDPARLFIIESSMFGIPFDGYHAYIGKNATMQIKAGGLIQVVDAKGEKMDQGETVTMFNDMCLLAPATLISSAIRWEELDSLTVRGFFTNQGTTVSAILTFDPSGALKDFMSNDRFLSEDGKTYLSYPWSTPVREYRDFGGRKIAASGEAIWHTPRGEFPYGRYTAVEVEFNCRPTP